MAPETGDRMAPLRTFAAACRDVLLTGTRVSINLFKLMIPILVAVKILREMGLVEYLAMPLAPVMGLMGLPAQTGLVWASAILVNIYSGIIVLVGLDLPLTQAQATVLACIILVAHNLPVELSIAARSGARLPFQLLLRFGGAVAFGVLLNAAYTVTGTLAEPAVFLFKPQPADAGLWAWVMGEARNLFKVFLVITALMGIMRLLNALRLTEAINTVLRPVLRFMGIGPKASTIAVVGLVMGLAYGGGLIIHEARSGQVARQDVFASLSLMGLCHSLIEDTLLMLLVAGHLSGILWGRLAFALVSTALLMQVVGRLSPAFCNQRLWSEPAKA